MLFYAKHFFLSPTAIDPHGIIRLDKCCAFDDQEKGLAGSAPTEGLPMNQNIV